MAQVNDRYSSSTVVELPQPIATLLSILIDCHIFDHSLTQANCQFFGGIAHGPFPFPKLTMLTWFTSLFWLIVAGLQLNVER